MSALAPIIILYALFAIYYINTALPKSYHKNLALPNANISSSQQIRKLLTQKHCNVCVVGMLL